MKFHKAQALALMATATLAVGVGVGMVIARRVWVTPLRAKLVGELQASFPLRATDERYTHIAPLLLCEAPESDEIARYKGIEDVIAKTVANYTAKGDQVSVYFHDGLRGRWIGVNEDERYIPASMLKVVVMVAYFKEAQDRPERLAGRFFFTSDIDAISRAVPYETPTLLRIGQSYSVQELIRRMIVDSDNGALNTLLAHIDDAVLGGIYKDLNLQNPNTVTQGRYTISVRDYSLFLRVLYSATYLNRQMSERALDMLTQATYHDGLVAGVPQGVEVAHKFGEAAVTGYDGQVTGVELHDCGVIYRPGRPYVLCVMTKGKDVAELTGVIADVSREVWQAVQATVPTPTPRE